MTEPYLHQYLLTGTPVMIVKPLLGQPSSVGRIVHLKGRHMRPVGALWETDPVFYRTDEAGNKIPQGIPEHALMSVDQDSIWRQLCRERLEDCSHDRQMASYVFGRKI